MATERTVVVAGVPDSCLRRSVSCSVRPAYLRGHHVVGAAMTGNDIYKEKYRRVVAGILLHGGSVNLEQAITIEGGDFSSNVWIDCNRSRGTDLETTWSVTEEGKKWFYAETTTPVVTENDIYEEKYRRVIAGILLHGGAVNLEEALNIEGGNFSPNAWIDCNRSSRLDATWPKVDATWSVTEEGKKWFYGETTIPVVVQI